MNPNADANDKKSNALTFGTFEDLLRDENTYPCHEFVTLAQDLVEKIQKIIDFHWIIYGNTKIWKNYWKDMPTYYRFGNTATPDGWKNEYQEKGWQGKICWCLAIAIQNQSEQRPRCWITVNCLCPGSNYAMAQCKGGCTDPWMKTVRALNELKKDGIQP